MTAPQPIKDWAAESRRDIVGIFSDIDDTLTTGGRLEAPVLDAIERLRAAGLLFFPITGRPAGWCDMIARMLPVDGVVGENGAFYFRYLPAERKMIRRYFDDVNRRRENQRHFDAIWAEVREKVPGAALAADQPYRDSDLAIDFAEGAGPLGREAIDAIVDIFRRHGATAKVSSIHVNGWFGTYDKLTATQLLMSEQYATDLAAERAHYAFIGDSPNDAPMFDFFPNSVGVANLADQMDLCDALPRWIAPTERGAGFVDLAEMLLSVR